MIFWCVWFSWFAIWRRALLQNNLTLERIDITPNLFHGPPPHSLIVPVQVLEYNTESPLSASSISTRRTCPAMPACSTSWWPCSGSRTTSRRSGGTRARSPWWGRAPERAVLASISSLRCLVTSSPRQSCSRPPPPSPGAWSPRRRASSGASGWPSSWSVPTRGEPGIL